MIRELLPPETGQAFTAMKALRTSLADEESFVREVDKTLRAEGYRLVGAFDEGEASACAAAGFRIADSLAWGRYLYVDDLSTLPRLAGRATHGHLRPSFCPLRQVEP